MKNFGNKIDNDATSAGVVVASEYNSVFNELKGAVSPFLGLNGQDDRQLAKVIDISSKALFYNDVGSPNSVHLTRGATNVQLETLVNGMVVFFSPAHANTGVSTLKVNGLTAKQVKFNGSVLQAGALVVGVSYIAVYRLSDDSFHIDVLTGDSLYYRKIEADTLISNAINGVSRQGSFTATLHGKLGNSLSGAVASKLVGARYVVSGDLVTIEINSSTNSGANPLVGSEFTGVFSLQEITGLPFKARYSSFNSSIYGRGLIFDFNAIVRGNFIMSVIVSQGLTKAIVRAEATGEANSGWVRVLRNNAGCHINSISFSYIRQ